MSTSTVRPRAALLDVDGTLVDSNDQHARAWQRALEEAGHPVDFAVIRRLIGMGGDKIIPMLTPLAADDEAGERLAARRSEHFMRDELPTVRALPGARTLLEALLARDLVLVVATSAKAHEYEALVRVAGVEGLVDDRTTADDAARSKPDPDIILAALEKAGVAPAEAVMLGDTPYDVRAAGAAGVRCVALRSGGWGDDDLAGAVAVYDDPADLAARLDDSPFVAATSAQAADAAAARAAWTDG